MEKYINSQFNYLLNDLNDNYTIRNAKNGQQTKRLQLKWLYLDYKTVWYDYVMQLIVIPFRKWVVFN